MAGLRLVRLHFVVEGQTEETFVREILAPELALSQIVADVHKITTGRKRGVIHRGGFVAYEHLRKDLVLWMKQERQHPTAVFTTMVDLYRLPKDFPARDKSESILDPFKKVELLEMSLSRDINDPRLIPYIQIHEFEAILFSNPDAFLSAFPLSTAEVAELKRIRTSFSTPEHINEGADTAPSKRISQIFPGYVKTSYGLTIAHTIGLNKIRDECPHFDQWIQRLIACA